MKCTEFLARFSDFYDADASFVGRAPFEEHLARCPTCARYLAVVKKGVSLLRDLPPSTLRDDFRERLRYSIYRLEEERNRAKNASGASPVMLVVAAAAVLAAVVGAPLTLEREPSVELAPITVQTPLGEEDARMPRVVDLAGSNAAPDASTTWLESSDLWAGSNALLYERSRLFQSRREPGLIRTGLR